MDVHDVRLGQFGNLGGLEQRLPGVAPLRFPKLNRIAFGIVQTSKSSVWIKFLINVYGDSSGT
jgi:hypothetical protein